MEFGIIKQNLIEAMEQVQKEDAHLLIHDISERAIAHRLAMYLTPKFADFDVDCEYNGDVDAESGRKYIYVLKQRAEELGLVKDKEQDQELVYRCVYPDIIVHKRGRNGPENNLLIVEVKKSSSKQNGNWDAEKLSRFTSTEYDNHFAYHFRAFVCFGVGHNVHHILEWYQGGQRYYNFE